MRLQLIPLIILYGVLLITDLYILADIRWLSGRKKDTIHRNLTGRRNGVRPGRGKQWVFAIFAIAVIAVLTLAILMPRRDSEHEIQAIMWMLYAVLVVFVSQVVYTAFSLIGRLPALWRRQRVNTAVWLGIPLAALSFVAGWWGALVGRHQIDVEEVTVSSPKLPASFDGYRIAQISDIHVGTWDTDTTFISELVGEINALHPDLIVFTGDIVNRQTSELKPFLSVLSRLKAPDGVLSILGNHDYGDYITWNHPSERDANNELMAAWQKQMGWRMLNNEHLFLSTAANDSIVVIGVENWGEPPFPTYGRLTDAYPLSRDSAFNLNDSRFKILLSHNPEHWNREVSKISNIDLTLSGHTHAMQIMLTLGGWRWSPAQYKYDQWGGLYTRKNPKGEDVRIYVNIGAGEVALPMRIGATPEITLITLRNEDGRQRK